jgi:hypothetical protein
MRYSRKILKVFSIAVDRALPPSISRKASDNLTEKRNIYKANQRVLLLSVKRNSLRHVQIANVVNFLTILTAYPVYTSSISLFPIHILVF